MVKALRVNLLMCSEGLKSLIVLETQGQFETVFTE